MKKLFKQLLIIAVVAGQFSFASAFNSNQSTNPLPNYQPATTAKPVSMALPGQLIITFKKQNLNLHNSDAATKLSGFTKSKHLKIKDQVAYDNTALVQSDYAAVAGPDELQNEIDQLKSDPNVAAVQPNYKYSSQFINSNDTYRGALYGLENIKAPESWSVSEGGNVVVAVVDTGVDVNHPDLAGNLWNGANCVDDNGNPLGNCVNGYDFADYDNVPNPDSTASDGFHGTHVAGTIGAVMNNGIGVVGVAPNVQIMAVRSDLTSVSLVRAIDFAKFNGAKVINASWGGNQSDPALEQAIASFPGLFVAAAGNSSIDNDNAPFYPCNYSSSNIICVAAVDSSDNLASFSDYGASTVDVAAPGVNIASTMPGGGYGYASGTSMAAPHVSGEAALIWSAAPNLSTQQVRDLILSSGDSISALVGRTVTGKRINVLNALNSLNQPVQASIVPDPTPAPVQPVPAPSIPSQPAPVVNQQTTAPYPNGTLIKSGAEISIIQNGMRRAFPSMTVLDSYGLNLAAMVDANDGDLALPQGPVMQTKPRGAHREGTLIKISGTIYLIQNGMRRGIPSMAVFYAHGFKLYRVVSASSGDTQLPEGDILN